MLGAPEGGRLRRALALLRAAADPALSGHALTSLRVTPPHLTGQLLGRLTLLARLRGHAFMPAADAPALRAWCEEGCAGLLAALHDELYTSEPSCGSLVFTCECLGGLNILLGAASGAAAAPPQLKPRYETQKKGPKKKGSKPEQGGGKGAQGKKGKKKR
jgi:hypothetical protein